MDGYDLDRLNKALEHAIFELLTTQIKRVDIKLKSIVVIVYWVNDVLRIDIKGIDKDKIE